MIVAKIENIFKINAYPPSKLFKNKRADQDIF